MANREDDRIIDIPDGLSPAQQRQVRLAIANALARQREADKDMLDEAKELRREAARLEYIYLLRNRCKSAYKSLSPLYTC